MEKMTKVLRYDNVLTARVSDADFRAVCERADEEGLTRSEYLRYVARMVADDAENAKRGGVLLDGLSMRRLSRELVRWGHHYNQGVHALNSIKFALDHGRGDLEWVSSKLDECALLLAQVKGKLNTRQVKLLFRELGDTAEQIQWILDTQQDAIHEAALACKDAHSALFVGRGMGAAISNEGALKLKEISYLHAEAYAAGEMKHGPIALIDPGFPVIAVTTKSPVYDKVASNLKECEARGAKIIVVATEGDEDIKQIADYVIYIPEVRDAFTPITATVPLQLLAREVALMRGCDVDQPRNLAKSVTVE